MSVSTSNHLSGRSHSDDGASYCDDDITDAPSMHLTILQHPTHSLQHISSAVKSAAIQSTLDSESHYLVKNGTHMRDIPQDILKALTYLNQNLNDYGLRGIDMTLHKPISDPRSSGYFVLQMNAVTNLVSTVQTLLDDTMERQELVQELISANKSLKEGLFSQRQSSQTAYTKSNVSQKSEEKLKLEYQRVLEENSEMKSLMGKSLAKIKKLEYEVDSYASDLGADDRQYGGTRREMKRVCDELAAENKRLHEHVEQLNRQLLKITKERDDDLARQNEVFRQLKKRLPDKYTASDRRLLDIIQVYETRIRELQRQCDLVSHLSNVLELPPPRDVEDSPNWLLQYQHRRCANDEVVDKLKEIIQSLQTELSQCQKQRTDYEVEHELIKLELTSRPTQKELTDALVRVKKYESIMRRHNIDMKRELQMPSVNSVAYSDNGSLSSSRKSPRTNFSGNVADLRFLPLSQCQHYLHTLYEAMDYSPNDTHLTWEDIIRRVAKDHGANEKLQKSETILDGVCQLLESACQSHLINRISCHSESNKDVSSKHRPIISIRYDHIQPLIRAILTDFSYLPSLEAGLRQLHRVLCPWSYDHSASEISESYSSERSVTALYKWFNSSFTSLLEGSSSSQPNNVSSTPSSGGLNSARMSQTLPPPSSLASELVKHFQQLFDCPQYVGVYAKMNQIFTRLHEMQNVLRAVARAVDIEGVEGDLPHIGHLVRAVEDLRVRAMRSDKVSLPGSLTIPVKEEDNCQKRRPTCEICGILSPEELVERLEKAEEYDAFFPLFNEFVEEIMHLLEVNSIEKVCVTLRALLSVQKEDVSSAFFTNKESNNHF